MEDIAKVQAHDDIWYPRNIDEDMLDWSYISIWPNINYFQIGVTCLSLTS